MAKDRCGSGDPVLRGNLRGRLHSSRSHISPTGGRSRCRGRGSRTHYYYGHYYSDPGDVHRRWGTWSSWWPLVLDEFISNQTESGSWSSPSTGSAYATAMSLIVLQMPKRYRSSRMNCTRWIMPKEIRLDAIIPSFSHCDGIVLHATPVHVQNGMVRWSATRDERNARADGLRPPCGRLMVHRTSCPRTSRSWSSPVHRRFGESNKVEPGL